MDDIYGIIPVSKFKECKTRLSPFLSEEEREKIAVLNMETFSPELAKVYL